MTFTFLPSRMFCVSILTKESLSGRDCSWNNPRACPTKKIIKVIATHLMVPINISGHIRSAPAG